MTTTFNDQRSHPRLKTFEWASLQAPGLAEPIQCVILEVGLGGFQIQCRTYVEPGTVCRVFAGPLEEKEVGVAAEVRHVQSARGSNLFTIGLKFAPRSHEERLAVARFVHAAFERVSAALAS